MAKIKGIRYKNVIFAAEINAAKTFTAFCEHEKHHGFTKEEMKPIHEACKAAAKKVKQAEPETDRPAAAETEKPAE